MKSLWWQWSYSTFHTVSCNAFTSRWTPDICFFISMHCQSKRLYIIRLHLNVFFYISLNTPYCRGRNLSIASQHDWQAASSPFILIGWMILVHIIFIFFGLGIQGPFELTFSYQWLWCEVNFTNYLKNAFTFNLLTSNILIFCALHKHELVTSSVWFCK